jgi:hypothetical protein
MVRSLHMLAQALLGVEKTDRLDRLLDSIKECVAVLNQERDSLSTLEGISEARVARHGLLAGLMARIKASMKTWRRAAR